MNTDETSTPPPKFRRSQRLIDPRFQAGMACAFTLMLIAAGAVYLVGAQLLTSDRFESWVGEERVSSAIMAAEVAFFLATVVVIHQVVVRVTHTVAGPMLVMERGLRALAEGRLDDARFSLRDGDYMRDVADLATETKGRMVQSHDCAVRVLRKLGSGKPSQKEFDDALEDLRSTFEVHLDSSDDEETLLFDSAA